MQTPLAKLERWARICASAACTNYLEPLYLNARKDKAHLNNAYLKKIGERADAPIPLTMYVVSHFWASAAKASGTSLSIISEGMGNDSERTTQIYLASLEASTIDANTMQYDLHDFKRFIGRFAKHLHDFHRQTELLTKNILSFPFFFLTLHPNPLITRKTQHSSTAKHSNNGKPNI